MIPVFFQPISTFFFLRRILWSMLSSRAFLCAARVLWVLANNLYCIPAYFAYMALSAPLLLFSPAAFWRMEEVFFDWLLSMVACWAYTAGYRVVESGDDLDAVANSGASFLFLPNHQVRQRSRKTIVFESFVLSR